MAVSRRAVLAAVQASAASTREPRRAMRPLHDEPVVLVGFVAADDEGAVDEDEDAGDEDEGAFGDEERGVILMTDKRSETGKRCERDAVV